MACYMCEKEISHSNDSSERNLIQAMVVYKLDLVGVWREGGRFYVSHLVYLCPCRMSVLRNRMS